MMKNYWVQTDKPFATWVMDLESIENAPERLVALVLRVLQLGEEHGVYQCSSSTSEEIGNHLQARWSQDRTVEFFRWRAHDAFGAHLSWFDRAGELTDGPVGDLGKLSRVLEPTPDSIFRIWKEMGVPPLEVYGGRIEYQGTPLTPTARGRARAAVFLHSDIWFPFVAGSAHPWADGQHWFDNRELASRHTPRLNRFLAAAQELVILSGGMWELLDDDCNPRYLPWIGPDGIQLDGPVPELMPPGAEDVTWPDE
ncbi:MAG: hypothetical protein H6708_32590 [Kofleriaceae bacterium]|nr:hypothetical protein [Myxococcales bacterium]MCB9565148.1 hypothetical protein [Kofleriaceae bacterium]